MIAPLSLSAQAHSVAHLSHCTEVRMSVIAVVIAMRLWSFAGAAVAQPLLVTCSVCLDKGNLPLADHPAARALLAVLRGEVLPAAAPGGGTRNSDSAAAFSELDL